jgi:predicted transcriptional regulator
MTQSTAAQSIEALVQELKDLKPGTTSDLEEIDAQEIQNLLKQLECANKLMDAIDHKADSLIAKIDDMITEIDPESNK